MGIGGGMGVGGGLGSVTSVDIGMGLALSRGLVHITCFIRTECEP